MIRRKRIHNQAQVKITFVLPADHIPTSVVGSFNDWNPNANPLRRRNNGTRSATVTLPAGHRYTFRYLCSNGHWCGERMADDFELNAFGTYDCVIFT
jgi:1,4-alpha-glucan branching enzyme